tara:strand:- start:359 stop:532 length:174 start_codon:yes stop_codon:yes gene_type:complete
MQADEAEFLHIIAQIIREWSYELIDNPYGDVTVGGTLRERMNNMSDSIERVITSNYD